MNKHKTEDYKISAVKYYLNNEKGYGYKKTCKFFDCKKSTLRVWIKRYNTSKNLTRINLKSISYKITKPQVKTALELLKKNEQLIINELAFDMKQKYPTFDITPQHLGHDIRDNNQTIKITRHEHLPKEIYKKPNDKQTEMNPFYQKIKHYPLNKIICLDETIVGSALRPTYSRFYLGRICRIKTSNQFVFRKFTLLVVCFGDYEQKQQMKYKEATKGKCMRTLFRKAGFQTYLVDEFRTRCNVPNVK